MPVDNYRLLQRLKSIENKVDRILEHLENPPEEKHPLPENFSNYLNPPAGVSESANQDIEKDLLTLSLAERKGSGKRLAYANALHDDGETPKNEMLIEMSVYDDYSTVSVCSYRGLGGTNDGESHADYNDCFEYLKGYGIFSDELIKSLKSDIERQLKND